MLSEKAILDYVSVILQRKGVPEKFTPVMAGVLSRAYYNSDEECMEIVTNTYVKKEIAKKIGLKSPGAVSSGLAKLTEAGFLDCIENGVYRLSEAYFGIHPWGDIQEIRITQSFGATDENIQISAVYSDHTEDFPSIQSEEDVRGLEEQSKQLDTDEKDLEEKAENSPKTEE
mgnify:CR=1 FL=1